jgi:hypothetical protein
VSLFVLSPEIEDRDEVEVVTEKSTESKMKFFVWKFLLYWTITYFRQLF